MNENPIDPPGGGFRAYQVCGNCGRGQNPLSPLKWYKVGLQLLCEHCYTPPVVPPPPPPAPPSFAVVTCPGCRGAGCEKCCQLSVVRIPLNAIPVWGGSP